MITLMKVLARSGLITACVLACCGCKENAKSEKTTTENAESESTETVGKAGSGSAAKLEAIRQAGYPVTLAELHAWYAEPPAGENGAAAYQEAFAALVGNSGTPTFLKDNSKALQLLHQAATGKKCRYAVNLLEGNTATMPYLAKAKTSAQLLKQAAIAQATGGRMDLAAQSVADSWLLARSLEEEPTLISQLVRIAAEIIAHNTLAEVLSRKALSETQLATLKNTLGESDGMEGFTRAAAGERALCIAFFQQPPEKLAKILTGSDNPSAVSSIETYRKSAAYEADLNFYLERAGAILAATTMPFPNNLETAGRSSDHASEAKDKGFQISFAMLPALTPIVERAGEIIGQRRAARAGLAVERYRLAHQNALPDTLDQLVPQFLAAVPADPLDGKPLRYTKKSPGYVIYSIGKDRKDDGGSARDGERTSSYDVTFTVRR